MWRIGTFNDPISFTPAEVLRPAIRGVLGILESTHKYGQNVKRIVLTSSVAAIGEATVRDGKPVRDEASWFLSDPIGYSHAASSSEVVIGG
jgi:nucleoside-diphosphate-sugar epimerase